jgi:hypothetical protein
MPEDEPTPEAPESDPEQRGSLRKTAEEAVRLRQAEAALGGPGAISKLDPGFLKSLNKALREQAADPERQARFAAARAAIISASERSQRSQEEMRAYLATPHSERLIVEATKGVEVATLAAVDAMGELLAVAQASLTTSEEAAIASAKSDRVIRLLTVVLVVLTVVLALPVIADLWRDGLLPFISWLGSPR